MSSIVCGGTHIVIASPNGLCYRFSFVRILYDGKQLFSISLIKDFRWVFIYFHYDRPPSFIEL